MREYTVYYILGLEGMAGAAGLQNRAALQQQLLQRGLVTKAAYTPGYQVLRPDGHMQPRGVFHQLCCW